MTGPSQKQHARMAVLWRRAQVTDRAHDRNEQGVTVANDGTVYQPGELAYPDGPRYGEAFRAGHDRAALTAMYRAGKKAAGRDLDGRTWDEFPTTPQPTGSTL